MMTKITEQRLSELNCSTITDREVRKAKYGDGWIEWKGGERPVAIGTPIRVRHRDGDEFDSTAGGVAAVRWDHTGSIGDIIAYRIAK